MKLKLLQAMEALLSLCRSSQLFCVLTQLVLLGAKLLSLEKDSHDDPYEGQGRHKRIDTAKHISKGSGCFGVLGPEAVDPG